MAWYDWYQDDLPCQFSTQRLQENRGYLEEVLGTDFAAQTGDLRLSHPLFKEWHTTGANAFLQLNGLAEDIRLVDEKPGLDSVLGELRDERQCLPSWHLLHTAALFERAHAGTVLEFVTPGEDEAPDALLRVAGDHVPLEAKLLTQSDDEVRFNAIADKITLALLARRPIVPIETIAYVILKEPVLTDVSAPAIEAGLQAMRRYSGTALSERTAVCNVFLEPTDFPGIADYRALYVMAPVPENEDIRVLGRAKKASRQLRSLPSGVDSGILSVGLSDSHDGASVFSHIERRIRAGHLRGISGVLLLKRRTHLGPPQRSNLDLLEFKGNPAAQHPLRGRLPLAPAGAAALLTRAEPHLGGIRAYRVGIATGRVVDPSAASFALPDRRLLTVDLIA